MREFGRSIRNAEGHRIGSRKWVGTCSELRILKSMSKAIYQTEHEQHYALNMAHYCHFTSPIRRYPDLVVHRVVQRLLELRRTDMALPLKKGAKELGALADPLPILTHLGHHCSDQEQNAEAAERELTKVKLLHFMSKKVGEELHGSIITVRDGGFFVRATEIPAEGWVSVESLPPDRYRFDSEAQVVEGYRNGSTLSARRSTRRPGRASRLRSSPALVRGYQASLGREQPSSLSLIESSAFRQEANPSFVDGLETQIETLAETEEKVDFER